ncbi:antiterminator [Serratia symbiotica]|uniref:antiterminator Q family protein n=1 Tax=Serratia symbiotica TaxID=138074 RepID=UPI002091743F|nr:antiterminator Q family protein [Serratia symbiotica]USS95160.1 antiterminator [Serratia symbiotica]
MTIQELKLTKEQHDWVNGWLELWGAWVYSGRLDKRQSRIIAQYMATVTPPQYPSRPMCNDHDGMLISQVVDSVMCIDKKAFGILLSYYAHGSTEYAIAVYRHKTAKPRKLATRGGNRLKQPSLATCRREVKEILSASLFMIYTLLLNAVNERNRMSKFTKIA